LNQVGEAGVVMVHCSYSAKKGKRIRIWNSVILFDQNIHTSDRSQLLHAINIPFAPEWKEIKAGTIFRFTLIFSSLPENCTLFDLYEETQDPEAIIVHSIGRNKDDVYHVKIK